MFVPSRVAQPVPRRFAVRPRFLPHRAVSCPYVPLGGAVRLQRFSLSRGDDSSGGHLTKRSLTPAGEGPKNIFRRLLTNRRIPVKFEISSVQTPKDGGCSSVGRVPDCDSGCRGFESHFPPQKFNARTEYRAGVFLPLLFFPRRISGCALCAPRAHPFLPQVVHSARSLRRFLGRFPFFNPISTRFREGAALFAIASACFTSLGRTRLRGESTDFAASGDGLFHTAFPQAPGRAPDTQKRASCVAGRNAQRARFDISGRGADGLRVFEFLPGSCDSPVFRLLPGVPESSVARANQ